MVADDLFIYQVDRAGERFRLHPMFAAFLRARLKSLGGTQFREAHLRAAAASQERGDRLAAMRHAMAVADMQLAAAILADSMRTILDFTDAQQAKAVARAWLAKFGDAAAEADPGQLLQFVLPLASAGHREAEGWLTKVNQAHPSPAPGLDALAHGTWAAYYLNRGSADLALEHNRAARQAVSAAAGQSPLFPMLAQLPLQETGAHLLAGDLPAAAAALHRGPAPLSAPIVDEFRSPVVAAWVAFLQGDLVSAGAALDRVRGAAAEHDAVAHGLGQILANLAQAGIHLERREHQPAAALLAAAREAARINGRPFIQTMVDTWIARLATAQGDRAGALASLGPGAPGPGRARRQGPGTVRARGVPHRARAGASRSERADPAAAGQHRLKAAPGPAARPAAGVGESRADPGGHGAPALSASGWNGGSSAAWRPRRPTPRGRTATCGRPWRWPPPRLPGHHHRAGTRHHRPAPFPAGRHRSRALCR